MNHASFCSGIDGPALAASWLGWEQMFYGDINEFALQVLRYYYPNAKEYNDIRTTDLAGWLGKIDVLTIGFPCQPFSVAGLRTGESHDSYLWPETIRIVEQCRPRWFVGENVNGITSMVFPGVETQVGAQEDLFGTQGAIYERIDEYVIERICSDIEQIGYEVYPVVIPACAVGAPHERQRCFFLAYDANARTKNVQRERKNSILSTSQTAYPAGKRRKEVLHNLQSEQSDGFEPHGSCNEWPYSDSASIGQEQPGGTWARRKRFKDGDIGRIPDWRKFPTQPPVCERANGFPGELSGLSFSQWVTGCIESLGNAIVPQEILEIYKLIEIIDNQL